MLDSPSLFHLGPDLVVHLNWSAHILAFMQDWQSRLQTAKQANTQVEEHLVEAALIVLGTIEQLGDHTAQVLTDLYRLSGQLPAPKDKLLVGPLELRVEERIIAVSRSEGSEQVAVTYCLDIVRYRYEAAQPVPFSVADFLVTA